MTVTYAMTSTMLLIGLAIMLFDVMSKLRGSSHRYISAALTVTVMAYVALDCIWIVAYTADDFNRPLFTVVNVLFYLTYITLPYMWFLFAQHFAYNISDNRKAMIALGIPWIVNFALVVATAAGADLLWSIGDTADRYARGPLFDVFSALNLTYYFIPVVEITVLLASGRGADRRTLLATLAFSLIPALGVLVYTCFISVDAIYPFQPCCFFIGIMFAYIMLISQVHNETLADNLALAEQARVAQKIADLTESMGSLLTNMPALTFSKDVETGKYMACNQLFAEYACKPTPNEVVGLTDYEIFDDKTAAHFIADDKKALSMDEPYIFFEDVPDAAGEQHQFQTTKLKFTDAHGRLCTLGMCVDVTEVTRVRREADVARMEKEIADAQNQAKSTFLSNMSHDIRTPMNAIIGFTDIALKDLSDPEATRDYLGKVKASSEHLLSLINDILEMSRIESGKITLDEAPCHLPDLVDDLHSIIIGQVEERGHELTVEMSLRDEDVCCDKLRLSQVLINMLSNAVKYTPQGGKIALRVEQHDDASEGFGTYEFRVSDNGIGMAPEFAERIFDAFERERNSTVSGIQGTGLGMAITKRIVDLMGGDIAVTTAPGEGSEFTVKIPLKLQDASERHPESASDAIDPLSLDLSGRRVLLVEDMKANRVIAAMMLGAHGLQVDEASDGQQAVDMVKAAEPGYYDAVLMDIQMPVMNGHEATGTIRQLDPARAGVPIVAMTADAFEEDRRKALESGMNEHIAKPIDEARVIGTLARLWNIRPR